MVVEAAAPTTTSVMVVEAEATVEREMEEEAMVVVRGRLSIIKVIRMIVTQSVGSMTAADGRPIKSGGDPSLTRQASCGGTIWSSP